MIIFEIYLNEYLKISVFGKHKKAGTWLEIETTLKFHNLCPDSFSLWSSRLHGLTLSCGGHCNLVMEICLEKMKLCDGLKGPSLEIMPMIHIQTILNCRKFNIKNVVYIFPMSPREIQKVTTSKYHKDIIFLQGSGAHQGAITRFWFLWSGGSYFCIFYQFSGCWHLHIMFSFNGNFKSFLWSAFLTLNVRKYFFFNLICHETLVLIIENTEWILYGSGQGFSCLFK